MDKITLGIPIYNAVNLVERSLLSALNQTYPNIEYLLIDDKGDSMEVVRSIVDHHHRREAVRIIDQGYNQGIAAARNAILDHATGKYLFTMDCDDVITSDCIDILYYKMQEHPVDFVAASFVRCDQEGREYLGCQYEDIIVEGGTFPVVKHRYGQGKKLFVATWNKLYRLNFLKKYNIRCQAGHFNEDPWFTYQVIIHATSCHLIPDCTLRYTYNPKSVSGIAASSGYSEKIAFQFVEIQQLKSNYIPFLAAQDFYRNLLTDIMFMAIYHAYRIVQSPQLSSQKKEEYLRNLLTPTFRPPVRYSGGWSVKYILLRVFFALPMCIKRSIIVCSGALKVKDMVRRWIYFNE